MDGSGSSIIFLLIPVLLIGLLVFQRRSMKRQAEQIQSQLALGVEVMTGSGVFGTVRALRDDHVELEIAPGIVTRWARPAIARVIPGPASGHESDPPVTREDDAI